MCISFSSFNILETEPDQTSLQSDPLKATKLVAQYFDDSLKDFIYPNDWRRVKPPLGGPPSLDAHAKYSDIIKANTLSDGVVQVRFDKLRSHPKYRAVDIKHRDELVESILVCLLRCIIL